LLFVLAEEVVGGLQTNEQQNEWRHLVFWNAEYWSFLLFVAYCSLLPAPFQPEPSLAAQQC
jgi:hypothetical protein